MGSAQTIVLKGGLNEFAAAIRNLFEKGHSKQKYHTSGQFKLWENFPSEILNKDTSLLYQSNKWNI